MAKELRVILEGGRVWTTSLEGKSADDLANALTSEFLGGVKILGIHVVDETPQPKKTKGKKA